LVEGLPHVDGPQIFLPTGFPADPVATATPDQPDNIRHDRDDIGAGGNRDIDRPPLGVEFFLEASQPLEIENCVPW